MTANSLSLFLNPGCPGKEWSWRLILVLGSCWPWREWKSEVCAYCRLSPDLFLPSTQDHISFPCTAKPDCQEEMLIVFLKLWTVAFTFPIYYFFCKIQTWFCPGVCSVSPANLDTQNLSGFEGQRLCVISEVASPELPSVSRLILLGIQLQMDWPNTPRNLCFSLGTFLWWEPSLSTKNSFTYQETRPSGGHHKQEEFT